MKFTIVDTSATDLSLSEAEYLLLLVLDKKIQLKKPIYEMQDVAEKDLNELKQINVIEQKLINYMKG